MTDLVAKGVRLVPATTELLNREDISGNELAHALNVASPASWPPEFNGPETRAWMRSRLCAEPESSEWYAWYIIAQIGGVPTLAGIAGYKGPPSKNGKVEIGYAVMPEYQRRGIATTAVDLLCRHAFASGASAVIADTLPTLIASQALLAKTGFRKVEVLSDPDEGEVWRYQLERP